MPNFEYRAKNQEGQMMVGNVEAFSEEAVANLLSEKNLIIVDIKTKDKKFFDWRSLAFFHRIRTKDLVIFFRQLSVMIDANLPIVKGLRVLLKQTKSDQLKKVILEILTEVDGGSSLSSAMQLFPNVFTNFYINIVRSGETSGRLSEVMGYLADQQEKDYNLESQVKGAMIYPLFILGGLVIVGFIVMTFVIPQMTGMLIESGAQLPLVTRLLLGTSSFFQSFWWLLILLLAVLFVGFSILSKTYVGRHIIDMGKIKMPVFGPIFKNIYIVRICRSFSTLLKGGVPVSQSLEVVKTVVDNLIYEELLENTIKEVEEGNLLADSLALSPYIPTAVTQMISIGEETGKLEEVLVKIGDFYSNEIDGSVRVLSTLIEPIIMVILGCAVGVFIAAIIMPMWSLASVL
ncbi:MAG: type II secretion system F family protein [Patescibacteria group bacterium]